MATVVRRMAFEVLSLESTPGESIRRDHVIANKLADAIASFISSLERDVLSKDTADNMAKLLRAEQHLLACAEQAVEISKSQQDIQSMDNDELIQQVARYRTEVVHLVEKANPEDDAFLLIDCELQLEAVQISYDKTKEVLLQAGAELRTPIPGVIDTIEQNSQIRRMARQLIKAMRFLDIDFSKSTKQDDDKEDNGEPVNESIE